MNEIFLSIGIPWLIIAGIITLNDIRNEKKKGE